jgi:hypothetical protein
VGCFALLRNKLSYSNDFSTIFRTTRREELDKIVNESERIGGDPLPEGIARTKVQFVTDSGRGCGFEIVR